LKRLAAFAALIALASCSDSPAVKEAKQAVAAQFAYPSGVEFKNVRHAQVGFCGEVNGRMVDGQMSGFRRFYWIKGQPATVEGARPTTGQARFDMPAAQTEDSILSIFCEE
jgi:hypothetical protein